LRDDARVELVCAWRRRAMTLSRAGVGVLESGTGADARQPELSVVVPVFNQGKAIEGNLEVIRTCLEEALGDAFELIVVSDGSVDETEERMLRARSDRVRTMHYDRNLGKGYAVKTGALEARGRWIAFIDADLDLNPSRLAEFLRVAKEDDLDFAIGSKRHPQSHVYYPRSRRIASWLYQQLVFLLFQLDVRDTQVGIKLFRREIAEQVLPLLLVKRFAFDLELLAVSRALGFARIRELPITLEYRFAGSGVRSFAVVHALVDTAAVFYRLRILRTYQRKQRLLGAALIERTRWHPEVTIVGSGGAGWEVLNWPALCAVDVAHLDARTMREAALNTETEIVAFIGDGVKPAGNWLSATVPYLGRPDVTAVVAPKIAPASGTVLERGAAAVTESRFGGGSRYFRFTPGNLRRVTDYPDTTFVVRRAAFLDLGEVDPNDVCHELVAHGGSVVYTPETMVVDRPAPLFGPRFRDARDYGIRRGRQVRKGDGVRMTTLLPPALLLVVVLLPVVVAFGGIAARIWAAGLALYALVVLWSAIIAGLRFRSVAVGAVAFPGLVGTHVSFAVGFLRGLLRR
jgi:glycosyltransferase involved in cell wall biosynthesis